MAKLRKKIGFMYSPEFLDHTPPAGHVERPDRLRTLIAHLSATAWWDELIQIEPRAASDEEILLIHTQRHLDFIRNSCLNGGGLLDEGDTYAVERSCDVALLAAGAVLVAVDAVLEKRVDTAFCAVRPPGHHAERDRPMGFCLFNNVAVAARYAQRKHGIERVAILDWDVHHGNGTQHIFEEDSSVLYISLHQYPFYPGTGARDERGIGKGEGYTLNIPLPEATGEERYLAAFRDEIVPALKNYGPELLILSAGFDAHADDLIGGMNLDEKSFAEMTRLVDTISPVVSVLEGGYNLKALARSVESHLTMLGR